jgi:hypothetical protein
MWFSGMYILFLHLQYTYNANHDKHIFIPCVNITINSNSATFHFVNTYKTTIYIGWLIDTIFGEGGDEWDHINWLNPATCIPPI